MGSTGQHQEIAQISGRRLGQQIRVRAIPAGLINTAGAVVGRFSPMVKDLTAMMRWFQSGRYVADPTRQGEVFGQDLLPRMRSAGSSAAWDMRSISMPTIFAETSLQRSVPSTTQARAAQRGRSWSEVSSVPDVGRLTGGNVSPAPSRILIFRSGMPTSHRRTPHRE